MNDKDKAHIGLAIVGCGGLIGICLLIAAIQTLPVYLFWNYGIIHIIPAFKACTLLQAFFLSCFMNLIGRTSTVKING